MLLYRSVIDTKKIGLEKLVVLKKTSIMNWFVYWSERRWAPHAWNIDTKNRCFNKKGRHLFPKPKRFLWILHPCLRRSCRNFGPAATFPMHCWWKHRRSKRTRKNRGFAATWRIIPVSKYLVTPIYKPFRPFGRGKTLLRGLTNHTY